MGLARTLAFVILLTLAGLAPWGASVSTPALPDGEQRLLPLVGHTESAPRSQREPPTPATGLFGAMLKAIRVSSPPHLDMTFETDRLDGDWRLDGTVADGSGPGSLLVDLTVRPGMLLSHPCADAEFSRGAPCVERSLPDGDLLVLRDLVVECKGMRTIEVVLVHPDRSGAAAEAGNWTLAPLADGTSISQSKLPAPRVTRSRPVYTVQQLGRLVQAVDVRARRCITASCG